MEGTNQNVSPFDSFRTVYKILGWTGFYKLIDPPKKKYIEILHYLYRVLVSLFIIWYNVQHTLFFIFMFHENRILSFDGLMIEIPQFNLIAKVIAINIGNAKLEKLRKLMDEPIFAARSTKDEELLLENQNNFRQLTKRVLICVWGSAILWSLSAVFTRMKNSESVIPIYVPFTTNSWASFILTIVMEHGPVFWVGFGHLALDILIGCHYTQATVQLKIIRHNLEHLCDSDKTPGYVSSNNKQTYRFLDELDETIKKRFSHYVDRYAAVVWFVGETTAVFSSPMTVQLLTTSSVICLVIYKMALVTAGSMQFIFLIVYFFVLQLQVAVYCHFGQLLTHESTCLADAAYFSDWVSLSPRFRKQLLIGMARWSIRITPLAARTVSLSYNTFILLVRGGFNLFTVLKNTKINE